MDTYPPEAWRRLGLALQRRRAELGYGFRQRGQFACEQGGGKLSTKTISRLEKGERDSYPESTVATAEAMYRWGSGSFDSVLEGGEPYPLASAPLPQHAPAAPAAEGGVPAGDAVPTPGERIASWVHVRMRQLGHGEEAIQEFISSEGLPREPTTVTSVQRIAQATGASIEEILALLGVEDIGPRRQPGQPTAGRRLPP